MSLNDPRQANNGCEREPRRAFYIDRELHGRERDHRERDRDRSQRGDKRRREDEEEEDRRRSSHRRRSRSKDRRDTHGKRDERTRKRRSSSPAEARGNVLTLEERKKSLKEVIKNWDKAPAGFERIGADKAKLTGLFPPPGNITKAVNYVPPTLDASSTAILELLSGSGASSGMLPTSSSVFGPAMAKQSKRIYVSGLPPTANEEQIGDFFNKTILSLKRTANKPAGMGQPVLGVQISNDRSYAFVDFRASEDASEAIELDGVVYENQQLKIRRPREFQTVTAAELGTLTAADAELSRVVLMGFPGVLSDAHLRVLLEPFGELKTMNVLKHQDRMLGIVVFEFIEDQDIACVLEGLDGFVLGSSSLSIRKLSETTDDVDLVRKLAAFNLAPGHASAESSTVAQLLNMFVPEDLLGDEDYAAIVAEIQDECCKYGRVEELLVPRPETDRPVAGVGRVFVRFATADECNTAVEALAGRQYGDRGVITSFFPEDRFEARIL